MIKIFKRRFCKNVDTQISNKFKLTKEFKEIKDKYTRIHNVFRYDGFNTIKTDINRQKEIINREQKNFKSWQNYLKPYFKEWEMEVHARSQIIEPDIGEEYGSYTYYNQTAKAGYDILMRKDKNNKSEIVLDLKMIPFIKNINETSLKNLRLSRYHNQVAFTVDLANNEKFSGGIYDINTQKFIDQQFLNVGTIEFTEIKDIVLIVKHDSHNRPFQIVKYNLVTNIEEIVLEISDKSVYIETSPTKDHKYLIVNSLTKNDSKISIIDLNDPDLKPVTVFERRENVKYFIEHSHVNLNLNIILLGTIFYFI